MHGEFDPAMEVHGPDLEVCGPINWAGNQSYDLLAVQIEIVSVFAFQPIAGVVGYATPAATFTSPASGWEVTFSSAGNVDWVPGPALAFAGVRIFTAGRQTRWAFETWCMTISLFTKHED